jgi:hypothetical protein
MKFAIVLLFVAISQAKEREGSTIFEEPQAEVKQAPMSEEKSARKKSLSKKADLNSRSMTSSETNLPDYLQTPRNSQSDIKSAVILPTETKQEKLLKVRPGDTAQVQITHSIMAFPDETSPVVGVVKSGALRGSKLFGESRLEPNSKRVFVEFQKVSFSDSTYQIKASTLSAGIKGDYHTNEDSLFAGEFLSAFVAAYFDAQVPRQTNAYGQVIDDRSVDAATKKAMAAGSMSSADRFRQKLKSVPEFSEVKGPFMIDIVFSEAGQRL